MLKLFHRFTEEIHQGEFNSQPSMTRPVQGQSIEDLYRRMQQGLPLSGCAYNIPYTGTNLSPDDIQPHDRKDGLDMSEFKDFARYAKAKVDNVRSEVLNARKRAKTPTNETNQTTDVKPSEV